jgi:triosephosphate isomerase
MSETAIRPLVAGNWKMNGTTASLREPRLLGAMLKGVKLKCDVLVCPPATIIRRAKAVIATQRPPVPIPVISRPKC